MPPTPFLPAPILMKKVLVKSERDILVPTYFLKKIKCTLLSLSCLTFNDFFSRVLVVMLWINSKMKTEYYLQHSNNVVEEV